MGINYSHISEQVGTMEECLAKFSDFVCEIGTPTPAGSVSEQNCPSVQFSNETLNAFRICGEDQHATEQNMGGRTNYSSCFTSAVLPIFVHIYESLIEINAQLRLILRKYYDDYMAMHPGVQQHLDSLLNCFRRRRRDPHILNRVPTPSIASWMVVRKRRGEALAPNEMDIEMGSLRHENMNLEPMTEVGNEEVNVAEAHDDDASMNLEPMTEVGNEEVNVAEAHDDDASMNLEPMTEVGNEEDNVAEAHDDGPSWNTNTLVHVEIHEPPNEE